MADDQHEFCTYEEFGALFFRAAVTPDKILGAIDGIAGQPIDVGPMGVGPGRIAQVTATGQIGAAVATERPGDEIAYDVLLPVALDFTVNLQVDKDRFHANVEIPLVLTARSTTDLKIVVDITPPDPRQVTLELSAETLRASLLSKVANIDGELRRFVAKYVQREIAKPHITAARTIDLRAAIDSAWSGMAPRRATEDVVDAR